MWAYMDYIELWGYRSFKHEEKSILTKFSSLTATITKLSRKEVSYMTTFGEARDGNFVKMVIITVSVSPFLPRSNGVDIIESLCPSVVIWRQGSRSTLAQVMAWCLTAPSHYLNQFWLMIGEVLWHSPDSNLTKNTYDDTRTKWFD